MKNPGNQEKIALRTGLWGGPLFLASLLVFGALTPGYSHLHMSVSELGGIGTPWGLWFDLCGLFIPGLFIVNVAAGLRRHLAEANANTRWAKGLIVFGWMMALTAIPADFSLMFRSPWTWVHAFFALGGIPVLFVVIPGNAKALRALGVSSTAVRIFVALGYLTGPEFLLYGVFPHTPGLVQRLMIFTVHCAISWMSWTMLRLPQPRPE